MAPGSSQGLGVLPSTPPPWLETVPEALLAVDGLPERVDVAIVGGGLAGLSAARFLALGGASVAVVEARPQLGGGFATRAPGLVLASLGEHPGRLVGSVGLEAARQMHAFLAESRAIMDGLGLLARTGSLSVGAMPGEGEEIAASLEVLPSLGVPCQGWSAPEVARHLGSVGLDGGRFVPEDGVVDPVALVLRLARDARAAGAHLAPGRAVTTLDERAGIWQIRGPGLELSADAVVLAAGAGLRELVPFFRSTVYAVRHQWIATGPLPPGSAPPLPVLGQQGFSHWLGVGERLVAGGARFATVEMEAGRDDDGVIEPRVDHALRANLARFFPQAAAAPIPHAWSAIAAHTCDGLPLIGPLPGQPQLVACTGFHALDHSLAPRAGQAVAQGLLTGRAQGVPRLFMPTRLV